MRSHLSFFPELRVILLFIDHRGLSMKALSNWLAIVVSVMGCAATGIGSSMKYIQPPSSTQFTCEFLYASPMAQTGTSIGTRFQIPDIADTFLVTISILDTLSNQVFNFGTKRLQGGKYSVVWTYEDNEGQAVAPGIYVFQLTAESRKPLLHVSYAQRIIAFSGDNDP